MKRLMACVLALGLWCHHALASVGFREWRTEDGLQLSVWYPSDAATSQRRLGPFALDYAFDGAPRAGHWPLVVFSHGNGGHVHNHYLSLQALAEAGFIVVAPQHGPDGVIKTLEVEPALAARVRDIDRAVRAAQADSQLSPVMDKRLVHALGYGLGGSSVLLAAGATLDETAIHAHCRAHASEDLDLCSNDPVSALKQKFSALWGSLSRASSIDAAAKPVSVHGAVAVVAPMGQGLVVDPQQLLVSRLLTVAIEGDVIRPPRFHAQVLHQTMAAALPQANQLRTLAGHHYAFLAPLPSWMLKKNEYFTVNDPPGFDRPAFLQQINATLLRFFTAP